MHKRFRKLGTVALSTSMVLSMNIGVFATESPIEENPAGNTIETTATEGRNINVNNGVINTVDGTVVYTNNNEIGEVTNGGGIFDNEAHIGHVSEQVQDQCNHVYFNGKNAVIDVLDGDGRINIGYIKEKTEKSGGVQFNTGIIESDNGQNASIARDQPGSIQLNYGLVLDENNVVFANYGVINMGEGYGVGYNGISDNTDVPSTYVGYPEKDIERFNDSIANKSQQGIIISDNDKYALGDMFIGANCGTFIFREGAEFMPQDVFDFYKEFNALEQKRLLKGLSEAEENRYYELQVIKNPYVSEGKDYFYDVSYPLFGNPNISASTFIALDEESKADLERLVGNLNEGLDDLDKNKVVFGAALYETNLGALGANWVGKVDADGKAVTTLKNDEAKEYLEQICKVYGYDMSKVKIAGYVNIPVGTDISKYADALGLFTQQSAYDGNFELLTDDTILQKGVTYHLYYVLVSEVKTKDGEKKEYIIIPSGGSSNSRSGESSKGEKGRPLTAYTRTDKGYVPFVSGNTATAGWASITEAVLANANGSLDITMNGTATVDNNIMATAAASNTSLELSLDNDVKVGLTPAVMNQIMSLPTVDEAGNPIQDEKGNPVTPYLRISSLTYSQGTASPDGTCGFLYEDMQAIGANEKTPVVKVKTSNTDRTQVITIVFNAKEAGIQPGETVYLYGGCAGSIGRGGEGIVDANGFVSFNVLAVDGIWTFGIK